MQEARAEEEIKAEGCAEKFGEIGGHGGDFRRDPQKDGDGTRESVTAVLREGFAGGDAQLGGEILHEDGHEVRPEEDPEQLVAEAGASVEVGGEVAGIDVGDAGDEGGAEVGPQLGAAHARQQGGTSGLRGGRGGHGCIIALTIVNIKS